MQITRDTLHGLRARIEREKGEACREANMAFSLPAQSKYDDLCAVSGALATLEIYLERTGPAAANEGRRERRFPAAPGSGALPWSAEKPKRRGWWWVLDPDFEEPRVLRVDNQSWDAGRLAAYSPLDGWQPIDTCPDHWRWAGPLVEPVAASDAQPLPNAKSSDSFGGRA